MSNNPDVLKAALPMPSLSKAPTHTAAPPASPPPKWNTKNLLPRLATDAVASASAAVMVAPLITIIDK